MSPNGTDSPIFGSFGLTAEVSIVMVGALCLLGPGEGESRVLESLLSDMMGALRMTRGRVGWGCERGAVSQAKRWDAKWNNGLGRHADAMDSRSWTCESVLIKEVEGRLGGEGDSGQGCASR